MVHLVESESTALEAVRCSKKIADRPGETPQESFVKNLVSGVFLNQRIIELSGRIAPPAA
jgi:hypothetical protein